MASGRVPMMFAQRPGAPIHWPNGNLYRLFFPPFSLCDTKTQGSLPIGRARKASFSGPPPARHCCGGWRGDPGPPPRVTTYAKYQNRANFINFTGDISKTSLFSTWIGKRSGGNTVFIYGNGTLGSEKKTKIELGIMRPRLAGGLAVE